MDEANLVSVWDSKFKEAMVAKSDYTKRWQRYWDAYFGDYFKDKSRPDYKSNLVSNYIFSIIETIRPIMLDQNPKFQAVPRQPEGLDYSSDIHEALGYEWDRECMDEKLYRDLITTLVTGSSVYFVPWDSKTKNVKSTTVDPRNLFPDPLATSPIDAEYIIYATYKHEGQLKQSFPDKADKLSGSAIRYSELVHENDKSSVRIDNQILTLEIWTRDWTTEVIEEKGLKKAKQLYPNGRVLTVCPELGIILSDKANPYVDESGSFPFVVIKDYDVPGKFWGEGEVAQLISPQTYMNDINNAIIDNAKRTANMPWIIDKNSGIANGSITDRPGLIIRKNPGSEVRRDAPPPLPAYIQNAVSELKHDMEQISGVFDTLKGNSETGVYTAQGILALQEAGQARIRLKVKLLERSLGKLGQMWFARMKQFWKGERFLKLTHADGTYDLKIFKSDLLDYDFDIKITAGSTMAVNRGAMLDLMIRLAQTAMPDGQPLVDREAVVTYLPEEVKSTLLRRMGDGGNVPLQQLQEQVQQMSQENEQRDQSTIQTVEQLVSAVEKLKSQILQLSETHAKMVEKEKQNKLIEDTRNNSYNEGYADAEKLLSMDGQGDQSAGSSQQTGTSDQLPDDVLHGINRLSDDELQILIQQNPDLVNLINSQN